MASGIVLRRICWNKWRFPTTAAAMLPRDLYAGHVEGQFRDQIFSTWSNEDCKGVLILINLFIDYLCPRFRGDTATSATSVLYYLDFCEWGTKKDEIFCTIMPLRVVEKPAKLTLHSLSTSITASVWHRPAFWGFQLLSLRRVDSSCRFVHNRDVFTFSVYQLSQQLYIISG